LVTNHDRFWYEADHLQVVVVVFAARKNIVKPRVPVLGFRAEVTPKYGAVIGDNYPSP
jgi:hypothetical protein